VEPDKEAFTALFRTSHRAVLRYILLRVDDPALAEDLTAETFACAWAKSRAGTTITVPWLLRTARNLVGNEYQRRARSQELTRRAAMDALEKEAARARAGEAEELRCAMARLRSSDALLLRLSYWEGLSAAEAGALLGCTAGAAWVRLSRARSALRALMGGAEA